MIETQADEVPANALPAWDNEAAWDALMKDHPPDVWYDGRQVFSMPVGALLGLRNRAVNEPEAGYLAISDGDTSAALPTFGVDAGGRNVLIASGSRNGFVPRDIAYHTLNSTNGLSFAFIGQADSNNTNVLWGTLDDAGTTNDYLAPLVGFWALNPYNARPAWISRSRNTVAATRDVTARELQGVPAVYLWTYDPLVGKRIYVNRTKVVEDTSAGARTQFTDLRGRLFRMNTAAVSLAEFKGKLCRFGAWSYALERDAAYLERFWTLAETLVAP